MPTCSPEGSGFDSAPRAHDSWPGPGRALTRGSSTPGDATRAERALTEAVRSTVRPQRRARRFWSTSSPMLAGSPGPCSERRRHPRPGRRGRPGQRRQRNCSAASARPVHRRQGSARTLRPERSADIGSTGSTRPPCTSTATRPARRYGGPGDPRSTGPPQRSPDPPPSRGYARGGEGAVLRDGVGSPVILRSPHNDPGPDVASRARRRRMVPPPGELCCVRAQTPPGALPADHTGRASPASWPAAARQHRPSRQPVPVSPAHYLMGGVLNLDGPHQPPRPVTPSAKLLPASTATASPQTPSLLSEGVTSSNT